MKKVLLVFLFLMVCISIISSEEDESLPKNWGFIFNASNIFLDIEGYQAGFGAKVLLDERNSLRFLADGFYSSSSDAFSISIGSTFERKILTDRRVLPFYGGFIESGYMSLYDETDEDNWTKNVSFPISFGAVLGVEFFIIENVSLFAEYNAVFEGSVLKTTTSVDGDETEGDREFSYTIDTGIGNESKIGVVIYLDDVIEIERD